MDLKLLEDKGDAIFNNPDVTAEFAHHAAASLGGGRIARRTNINVSEEGNNFIIKLSQKGLFPQSCFDPLYQSIDWTRQNGGNVNWSGDGGRNEWATVTVPKEAIDSFLKRASTSRPSICNTYPDGKSIQTLNMG